MNTQSPKIQKHKVGVAGSFFNQLMSNNASIPVVGAGATIMHYTDRSVIEVLEVSEDGKTVKVEILNAIADKRFDNQMGHQNWIFENTGNTYTIIWRNNAWRTVGTTYTFTKEMIKEAEDNGFFSIAAYLKKFKLELYNEIYDNGNATFPSKEIAGIIVKKMTYSKINILWGEKNYYYDWSF